jgi:hypothetical protein
MVDSHKVWLIASISIFIIFLAGLVSIPMVRGTSQGEDTSSPLDGAVAYWGFEGDGNNVLDVSGNDNFGTITGATRVENGGIVGKAISFDGNGDYIDITNGDLGYVDKVSAFAWFKYTGTSSPTGWQVILGPTSLEISVSYVGKLRTGINVDATLTRYVSDHGSNLNLNDGEWHHVGFTFDGEIKKTYINGVLQEDFSSPYGYYTKDTIISESLIYSVYNRRMGSIGANYNVTGLVDEVVVFDRALTNDEVLQIYNNPGSGVEIIPEDCSNGIDDDFDGNIDCADEDCYMQTCSTVASYCKNGGCFSVDIDGNGVVDNKDFEGPDYKAQYHNLIKDKLNEGLNSLNAFLWEVRNQYAD